MWGKGRIRGLLSTRRVWIEISKLSHRCYPLPVTLHTESMDWNSYLEEIANYILLLLSTRRVWIEIGYVTVTPKDRQSYSPHGEYGWKCLVVWGQGRSRGLLSTRRVWIEISKLSHRCYPLPVTLHTESMDWNSYLEEIANYILLLLSTRRVWIEIGYVTVTPKDRQSYSPHGEYGLKCQNR